MFMEIEKLKYCYTTSSTHFLPASLNPLANPRAVIIHQIVNPGNSLSSYRFRSLTLSAYSPIQFDHVAQDRSEFPSFPTRKYCPHKGP